MVDGQERGCGGGARVARHRELLPQLDREVLRVLRPPLPACMPMELEHKLKWKP